MITKLSSVLTTRLRDILPKIIHPNQRGGIKGRSIHDEAALIRDGAYKRTFAANRKE